MSEPIYQYESYQKEFADKIIGVLIEYNHAYLNGYMRTRKTSIAIYISHYLMSFLGYKNILFVTKLNAIDDIKKDIVNYIGESGNIIKVTNYEQLHKFDGKYEFVVWDEAHCLGYIGKQKLVNKRASKIISKFNLYMTGTLFLESFSTAYSLFKPFFSEYKNFYQWSKVYVNIKKKRIGQFEINDYTEVKDKDYLMAKISKYIVSVSQEDAGFTQTVENVIHEVNNVNLNKLCAIIKKDKIYTLKDGSVIVADSVSKELHIQRQLQSGTIKINSENSKILDYYKIEYINNLMLNKKFAIYYEYVEELNLITEYLKIHNKTVTSDFKIFNSTDLNTVFAGQFVSKREGINLSSANDLVFLTMPYSNLSYLQTRERCMTRDKKEKVYCHFILTPFEMKIYKIVVEEKGKFNAEAYKKLRHEF